MRRICFGSLFVLMYQARGQGVLSDQLCESILECFGADISDLQGLPGHLKNGHDRVPKEIIDVVRECNPNFALRNMRELVRTQIRANLLKPLLMAALEILAEDDEVKPDTIVGWANHGTKADFLAASSVDPAYILTALVQYAVLQTDNMACQDAIREISKDCVKKAGDDGRTIDFTEDGILLEGPGWKSEKPSEEGRIITDEEALDDAAKLQNILNKYKKPDPLPVPVRIEDEEMNYVQALLDAYGDAEGTERFTRNTLNNFPRYKKDFSYERMCYYAAETIRRSLQDAVLPLEYKEFDKTKEEIKTAITPELLSPYDNGFQRLLAVVKEARNYLITGSVLGKIDWIGAAEKVGMCHMLANGKEVSWVDDDDV